MLSSRRRLLAGLLNSRQDDIHHGPNGDESGLELIRVGYLCRTIINAVPKDRHTVYHMAVLALKRRTEEPLHILEVDRRWRFLRRDNLADPIPYLLCLSTMSAFVCN